jgi:hypothetical protein
VMCSRTTVPLPFRCSVTRTHKPHLVGYVCCYGQEVSGASDRCTV